MTPIPPSIPILSISDAFAAFIAAISACLIFINWRKKRHENIGYFFATYVLVGFFFALLALPELVVHDPVIMQMVFSFSFIFLLLGLTFLAAIPLNIFGLTEERNFLFMFIGLAIATLMTLNFLFFSPAVSKTFSVFIYWTQGVPAWLVNLHGALTVILALSSSIFFLREGAMSSEREIRARSFLVGTGILTLVGAGFFNLLVSPNISFSVPIQVIIQIAVSLFLAAGFLILLVGILHKQDVARG